MMLEWPGVVSRGGRERERAGGRREKMRKRGKEERKEGPKEGKTKRRREGRIIRRIP